MTSLCHQDFYSRFREEFFSLFLKDTPFLLVAFSGGSDSAVLLHCLDKLSQEIPLTLHALHVDHRIRTGEGERDAAFARAFCDERGIPFTLTEKDVPSYAKASHKGLEEAARELRYEALRDLQKTLGASYIVTAHNATDQAETVLFHLARGTSLTGASGMQKARDGLLRPMLAFTKEEILAYAAKEKIPYVTDSTNSDTAYARNRIRHNVLPQLEAINPDAIQAILRFSALARRDDEALYEIAERYRDETSTEVLAKLSFAILLRVLLIKYREKAHNEIRADHLSLAAEKIVLANQRKFSGSLSLPGKITLFISQTEVAFLSSDELLSPDPSEKPLSPDHETRLSHYRIVVTRPEDAPKDADFSFSVPKTALDGITVRTRRKGDSYRSGNMTRSIKKLLCDRHVPAYERDALPFFLYRESLLFIPHLPPSDRLREWQRRSEEQYQISVIKL